MSKRKTALITGITGQDGSYLAELLLSLNYEVHGLVRRNSNKNTNRIDHIITQVTLHDGDLSDSTSMLRTIGDILPDEIYNLAAQSFVATSWQQPIATTDITAVGVTRILEVVRHLQNKKQIKFYQASSSEIFGKVTEIPQKETTEFYPRSPYGVAKLYGHWITKNYRESFNIHAVSGILFNHESPRRGLEFVTRKISNTVAKIKLGLENKIVLGNLDSKRDWGFAGDYVKAMWLMLQHNTPKDYVIATGEMHTVREFLEAAFSCVDLDYNKYVEISQEFIRPAEVDLLCGDPTLAKNELNWEPSIKFNQLVELMVKADLKLVMDQHR